MLRNRIIRQRFTTPIHKPQTYSPGSCNKLSNIIGLPSSSLCLEVDKWSGFSQAFLTPRKFTMPRCILLLVCCSLLAGCGGSLIPDRRTKTSGNIDTYRRQLEAKLLDRYNNLPEYAGKVSKVELLVPSPPEHSEDGRMTRVEFDQLVYDQWGERIPKLEKEYFIVTFGSVGVRMVSSDPSIKVGLDLEGGFNERAKIGSFNHLSEGHMIQPAPTTSRPPREPILVPRTVDDSPVYPAAPEPLTAVEHTPPVRKPVRASSMMHSPSRPSTD